MRTGFILITAVFLVASPFLTFAEHGKYNLHVQAKDNYLSVQPNPGSGMFTIIFRSPEHSSLTLSICDATGKYVYLKSIKEFNGELKETADLSHHPKGIYIVEVEGEGIREMKKIILQ